MLKRTGTYSLLILARQILKLSLFLSLFVSAGISVTGKIRPFGGTQTEQVHAFDIQKRGMASFKIQTAFPTVSALASNAFLLSITQFEALVYVSFCQQIMFILLFEEPNKLLIYNYSARIALDNLFTIRG